MFSPDVYSLIRNVRNLKAVMSTIMASAYFEGGKTGTGPLNFNITIC